MHEIIILSYHDIISAANSVERNEKDYYSISEKKFQRQLQIISESGINILDPKSLSDSKSTDIKSILLTFDDGCESHFSIVHPILEKHNTKGLFFPITSLVNLRSIMTWTQLEFLVEKGHYIGSHSHRHVNFEKLDKGQIIKEISHSNSILEQKLGKIVNFFAFPFGYYSKEIVNSVQELGVKKCFSTDGIPNQNSNNFLLHRININSSISDKEFKKIINGDPSYFKNRQRQKLYQSALRKVVGKKIENRFKQLIKRVKV